ncbi:MerR family transcriptional regulator [Bacillus sp. LS15-K4]|nr:MerR family transcriptional regulator [Bacillus sp. LS15-K4]
MSDFQIVGSPSAIFYDEEYIPNHNDIELRILIIYDNTDNVSRDKKARSASNCYYFTSWEL